MLEIGYSVDFILVLCTSFIERTLKQNHELVVLEGNLFSDYQTR